MTRGLDLVGVADEVLVLLLLLAGASQAGFPPCLEECIEASLVYLCWRGGRAVGRAAGRGRVFGIVSCADAVSFSVFAVECGVDDVCFIAPPPTNGRGTTFRRTRLAHEMATSTGNSPANHSKQYLLHFLSWLAAWC